MKLGALNYYKISQAIKSTGSYDPDKNMVFFEESLTGEEYDIIHNFLEWVHKNHKTFGSANYEMVFKEWQKDVQEDWEMRESDRKIRRAEQGHSE